MKKNLLLVLVLPLLLFTACSSKPGAAVIQFKQQAVDVGHIDNMQAPVTAKFNFTNTGGKPLKLINVASDCSCTIARFTRKPVAVGDSGIIEVKVNPKVIHAVGKFERQIVVHSNTQPRLHTLTIKMVVN